MRMCFIASAASIHSHKWINFFSDLGYDILWISIDPSTMKISKKITYYEVHTNVLFSIFGVRRLILRFNPDIVHVHYLGYNALMGLFSGIDCIVSTAWGSDIVEGNKSFFKRFIISKILRKSSLITCDAFHMRDALKRFGLPLKKITIINFGIDTNHFSLKKPQNNSMDTLECSKLTVISLRDFEPVYDIENLIQAIPIVLVAFPDVQFILLGRGTLKYKIISLVEDMGLDKSVSFLDYVENKNMPYIMSSADLLVSTSLSDAGIAGSTAEAMSCEVPVVVTKSGENDNWINHGKNGFLVPVSDPKELAKYIIVLLQNEQLRRDMGKEARGTILARNDYKTEMKKMLTLYKNLLK